MHRANHMHDRLGSVRLVVDSSTGQVAQRLDYDSWGVVTADSSPGFQPFGYAGGLYDVDLRLIRFGARDYDAETGRWLSPELMLVRPGFALSMARGGMQAPSYAYALNNPFWFTDPTGLDPGWWFPSPDAAARDMFRWTDQNQFGFSSTSEVGNNIYPLAAGLGPLEPSRPGYTYDPPVPLGGRSGGRLPASTNACGDGHNHPSGGFPSETDLIGFLGRAQQNGLPYTGFVSNNRWAYFNAPVARVPFVPANAIPTPSLRGYFDPQVDGQPIGGGLQWW